MTPTLSPQWLEWLAENALQGVGLPALMAPLVERGLDEVDARAVIDDLCTHPTFLAARRLQRRHPGAEMAARLQRTFAADGPFDVGSLDTTTFHQQFWTAHRPAVLRNATSTWPRMDWSLPGLSRAHGDVSVDVLSGRSRFPRWWEHREALTTTLPLRELLLAMQTTEGDDVYAVGRNGLLERLPALKRALGALPGLDDARPHDLLWLGPKGTVTPLHHDQSSAWLVQLEGRKRVWLASPLETALLETVDGLFSTVDPRQPRVGAVGDVRWLEAVLAPGDALFLPAGWWHQVVAETASVSVSRGGFRWSHTTPWYMPGR